MLEIRNLQKIQGGKTVLEIASFDLLEGQIAGIIARAGSGVDRWSRTAISDSGYKSQAITGRVWVRAGVRSSWRDRWTRQPGCGSQSAQPPADDEDLEMILKRFFNP